MSTSAEFDGRKHRWLIDVAMVILILLMAIICYLVLALPGVEAGNIVSHRTLGVSRHHFSTFDIEISDDWYGSGNASRIFRNDLYEEAYILAASISDSDAEADICKSLEINESTKFYRNKISFIYDNRTRVKHNAIFAEKVEGTLQNKRTSEDYELYGYYVESPKSYILALNKKGENSMEMKALVDEIFEGYKAEKSAVLSK